MFTVYTANWDTTWLDFINGQLNILHAIFCLPERATPQINLTVDKTAESNA